MSNFPFYRGSVAAAALIRPGKSAPVNTGLWYTRFYSSFKNDGSWEIEDSSKRDWIDHTVRQGVSGDERQIESLLQRQRALCIALGGQVLELESQGNFVTGTGLSHPVENGFTFHPVLGMPYLPASSVKGLLRGWVEVWMEETSGDKQALIRRWFGAAKGGDQEDKNATDVDFESAGSYIFFDALPTKPVHLDCDVMTPHIGKWYEQGGDYTPTQEASTAPADWHSPVPVPFLVVKSGTAFEFMVAPRLTGNAHIDQHTCAELPRVLTELKNALEWLGAGAKTAAGYGRMVNVKAQQIQAAAKNLADLGIKVGDEVWENASLTWEKGASKLTITCTAPKESVSISRTEGKKLFDALPETSRKKLEKGKPVEARVTVSKLGNQTTVKTIA